LRSISLALLRTTMARSTLTIVALALLVLVAAVFASLPSKSTLRISEVTEEKLAPHSISNSKIQRHAIGTTNVQDAAITGDKIAQFAVNERHIAPNSVTAKSLAVEEITILLRADDYMVDAAQFVDRNPADPGQTNAQGWAASIIPIHPSRTLLKPADMREVGTVENHYVSPRGFYYAYGRASGPGIILGWYPSLNGHLLRYQADRALRDISCNAVHTRDNYVRKLDYNMADYTSLPSAVDGNGRAVPPDFAVIANEAAFEARVELSGALEITAVNGQPGNAPTDCIDPVTGTVAGSLGDLRINPQFANGGVGVNQYRGLAYTHRSDPYSGNTRGNDYSYCFDEAERQGLGNAFPALCTCTINNPNLADSAAVFVHSRIWNPNNSPSLTAAPTDPARYSIPVLGRSYPVQDTWMLVHRYQDIGFRDKCILLPGSINGEDNVKCRQTQIWVDREYNSDHNGFAQIIPSYPYSSALTDAITARERAGTNIRSRDMFNPANPSLVDTINDIAGSIDNVYPYLTCRPNVAAGQPFYDRGIPFALRVTPFVPLPPYTSRVAVTNTQDRHEFCFVDGWRDRYAAEAAVAQRVPGGATAMFDNMPPERCSTYTNVGDLRMEAFDPDQADIPGPAEGTPVYSPSLERIEIDNRGSITIGFAGRGLPGTTQPDIAITVVVLLNSGVQYQDTDTFGLANANFATELFP